MKTHRIWFFQYSIYGKTPTRNLYEGANKLLLFECTWILVTISLFIKLFVSKRRRFPRFRMNNSWNLLLSFISIISLELFFLSIWVGSNQCGIITSRLFYVFSLVDGSQYLKGSLRKGFSILSSKAFPEQLRLYNRVVSGNLKPDLLHKFSDSNGPCLSMMNHFMPTSC